MGQRFKLWKCPKAGHLGKDFVFTALGGMGGNEYVLEYRALTSSNDPHTLGLQAASGPVS